jgi:3-phosphoshikimate 1-carboxyvinyltransferase
MSEAEPLDVLPFGSAPDGVVVVPGSKSITNRALVAAGLASGRSVLSGALFSDDTDAMISCLNELGISVEANQRSHTITVDGCDGVIPVHAANLSVRQSGTTARFLVPMVALGSGRFVVDAHPQMRGRPMAELAEALRAQGVGLETSEQDRLPFVVGGRIPGGSGGSGELEVRGDQSSQFLSGLLLSAPYSPDGLALKVIGELISRPYVDMTCRVMRSFGVEVAAPDAASFIVPAAHYQPTDYAIEPDASAASYFFGLAAITGGSITVNGLGSESMQGDMRFVGDLKRMGCTVTQTASSTTVTGPPIGSLGGGTFDMSEHSDTAPTMAAVAAFANEPVAVSNIGFIRHKESDRVGGVVKELQRCGVSARENDDGFTVVPSESGEYLGATIETYDDHRMAMAFSLVGCRIPGIQIANPGCVAKTFPEYFDVLESLRVSNRTGDTT